MIKDSNFSMKEVDKMLFRIQLFEMSYKKTAEKWINEEGDKKVFCNLYDILHRSMQYISSVNDLYIKMAFFKEAEKDMKIMDDILGKYGETK